MWLVACEWVICVTSERVFFLFKAIVLFIFLFAILLVRVLS